MNRQSERNEYYDKWIRLAPAIPKNDTRSEYSETVKRSIRPLVDKYQTMRRHPYNNGSSVPLPYSKNQKMIRMMPEAPKDPFDQRSMGPLHKPKMRRNNWNPLLQQPRQKCMNNTQRL